MKGTPDGWRNKTFAELIDEMRLAFSRPPTAREILTRHGCPDPLPRFLPIGTRTKLKTEKPPVIHSALQLVDKTVAPTMTWEPCSYIGVFSVGGGSMINAVISAVDIDWKSVAGRH